MMPFLPDFRRYAGVLTLLHSGGLYATVRDRHDHGNEVYRALQPPQLAPLVVQEAEGLLGAGQIQWVEFRQP